MKRSVLVTDGEQRAALAIVRSLGRAGHRVHVVSNRARSLAGGSRFAASESLVSDPLSNPDAFAGEIEAILRRAECAALIPVTEAALLSLLPRRLSLSGVLLPFAELES